MIKKKIKVRKKRQSTEDDVVRDMSQQVAEEIDREILKDLLSQPPGSTVSDPDDGQLDFGFLDFGSFFDSSDPDDAK